MRLTLGLRSVCPEQGSKCPTWPPFPTLESKDHHFLCEALCRHGPPRMKEPFSLEIFILGLKFSFSSENFNPGPCSSAAREGLGMKKPFSIENVIPHQKLDFFNIASQE